MRMESFLRLPLTLTLSPQAGRGNDLICGALSARERLRNDGECVYALLPVDTGRRWPPFGKSSGGRMRGTILLERGHV
ncbi:hypothetical protein C7U61_03465 [Rhizobium sp. JAB6]|nr:hypothetical protein C7U61_03465 [Rhizobium sp. JAB6]